MQSFRVTELRIGKVRPFGRPGGSSAIAKSPVAGPLHAGPLGLEGDEQADRRHHGGPEKAIHAYASANLAVWADELPERASRFQPGAFGENLVVEGVDEHNICLNDRWRLGEALLEVSQGRQPCWKLNLQFDQPDMAKRVQMSGRTGWYFRVIEPGAVSAGQEAVLIARPAPRWTIAAVSDLLYHDRLNRVRLAEFAALPGLPESWLHLAQARLVRGVTEDWSRRIETPSV